MTEDLGYVRREGGLKWRRDKTIKFGIWSKDERVWATKGGFNKTTYRKSADSFYGKTHDHSFRID
jgi:hypothetical protein